MKIKKTIKTALSILLIMIIFLTTQGNVSYSTKKTENKSLVISDERWVKNANNYEKKEAYSIITRTTSENLPTHSKLFQIFEKKNDGTPSSTNYFCLNARRGVTWNNVSTAHNPVDYHVSYDLATDKDEINKNLTEIYKSATKDSNYKQIMWLLDNVLVGDQYTDTDLKDLLAKAGIVYGHIETGNTQGYYYDRTVNPNSVFSKEGTELYIHLDGNPELNDGYQYDDENGNVKDVILSKELVEAIEQAAIWHFTNNNEVEDVCYTKETQANQVFLNNFLAYYDDNYYDSNGNKVEWRLLADKTIKVGNHETKTGRMLQEQACILFNYLVDSAEKAAKADYKSEVNDIKIQFTENNTDKRITKQGTDYKIGPLKVTVTGNTSINQIKLLDGDTEISGVTLQNKNGSAINKLAKDEEFYVIVPQAKISNSTSIKIVVDGKSIDNEKKLLIGNITDTDTNAEQPVVEITTKPGTPNDEVALSITKQFDLALRKIITKVDGQSTIKNEDGFDATRTKNDLSLNIDKSTIPNTATYKHRKDPIVVKTGSKITYEIRIFNEGEIDGYATKVIDQLPAGLKSVLKTGDTVTSTNGNIYTVNYDEIANKLELAMTSRVKAVPAYNGTLSNDTIVVEATVEQKAATDAQTKHYLTNIAYIAEEYDKDGHKIEADRDGNESKPTESPSQSATDLNTTDAKSYKGKDSNKSVYSDSSNIEYYEGQQDDDDFEKVVVLPQSFDVALRKFITKVSTDGNFGNTASTTSYNRAPNVDTSKLKAGTAKTAIYNHSKEPIYLNPGDFVLFTIRAYNEGELDGYASQITDYLPENLDFVDSTNDYIKSINDKWTYDNKTRKATTKADAKNATTKLKAFDSANDDGKGKGLMHVDVQIVCKVNKNVQENKKLTNIAEISEYRDETGNTVLPNDRDSKANNIDYPQNPESYKDNEINKEYVQGQQDDDDFEKVIVNKKKEFDLALRKFITNIQGKEVTSRIPKVEYKNNKITYTHPKDVVKLGVGNTVIYTLRVFNEGEIAGFAEKISDDIPEYLEFLPENKTNRDYRWVMYDKNGKTTTSVKNAVKIVTDYTSKAYGETLMKKQNLKENPNLLSSFDKTAKVSDKNPDYVDVKVAFKVKDPNSNKTVITNKAQISEDADENGNPVDDIDSTPNKWNDGEDDQDYENVSVEYFDLSLLKYVTKAIVTENGKTKTTKTGNNGSKKDITPKVEIYRKSINKTTVKFEYTIKITNEGDIEGYATEITDYVPNGLKFYKEDNKGWKDEGNNVISTELLKNTLLKPGQSATVKVVLRWINGENNLSLKTNIAEISKDKNEKGIPDRDSTPDNKKPGEDDIDDAPVLLTISTGALEHTITYVVGALAILITIGLGLVVIKKYVL